MYVTFEVLTSLNKYLPILFIYRFGSNDKEDSVPRGFRKVRGMVANDWSLTRRLDSLLFLGKLSTPPLPSSFQPLFRLKGTGIVGSGRCHTPHQSSPCQPQSLGLIKTPRRDGLLKNPPLFLPQASGGHPAPFLRAVWFFVVSLCH